MPDNENLTPAQLVEKGQKIYAEKLKKKLEPKDKGKFVAIEVESQDYFVGETLVEALKMAKDKYPNRVFHTVRIGFEGVFKMSSLAHGESAVAFDPFR